MKNLGFVLGGVFLLAATGNAFAAPDDARELPQEIVRAIDSAWEATVRVEVDFDVFTESMVSLEWGDIPEDTSAETTNRTLRITLNVIKSSLAPYEREIRQASPLLNSQHQRRFNDVVERLGKVEERLSWLLGRATKLEPSRLLHVFTSLTPERLSQKEVTYLKRAYRRQQIKRGRMRRPRTGISGGISKAVRAVAIVGAIVGSTVIASEEYLTPAGKPTKLRTSVKYVQEKAIPAIKTNVKKMTNRFSSVKTSESTKPTKKKTNRLAAKVPVQNASQSRAFFSRSFKKTQYKSAKPKRAGRR